jgi:hypothetical protein
MAWYNTKNDTPLNGDNRKETPTMEKHIFRKIHIAYRSDIKENEELTRLVDTIQASLSEKLNGEEKELLDKLNLARDEKDLHSSYESFKQGFRASIMLVAEAFG